MPTNGWNAYKRGVEAREKGVKFSKNPYKNPKQHVNWGLGWLESPKINQTVRRIQRSNRNKR